MPDPWTDETLAGVLVRGPQPVWVSVSDYDPQWVDRFRVRAAELRALLGDRVRLLEHIGSTSVPGLAAKPIVDIVLGLDDPDDEAAYLPELEAAGYDLRVREPAHRCLRTGGEPDAPVNLHCYPPEHAEVNLLIEHDRRTAHGFRNFINYRTRPSLTYSRTSCNHGAPRTRGPHPTFAA